jgi:hypothetical protein
MTDVASVTVSSIQKFPINKQAASDSGRYDHRHKIREASASPKPGFS